MSVSDLIATLILALLLLQAAVRLPGTLRGQRRNRPVSGAFTAFAISWWLRTGLGRSAVGPLDVNDLPPLLKHVLAIAGICVLLMYVYAEEDASAHHIRISALVQRVTAYASVATVVCMTAVFFLVLDRSMTGKDSPYFIGWHMGDPGLALYMGLFYAYVVAAALICAYQWSRAARRPSHWALRTGLTMMAVGRTLVVVHAVMRTAFLSIAPPAPGPRPGRPGTHHRHRAVRGLPAVAPRLDRPRPPHPPPQAALGLHPLRHPPAPAIDGIALHRPTRPLGEHHATAPFSLLRDVLSHDATPQIRLGRYVTEIRDATHELRRRAPADLYERAVHFAETKGHRGPEAAATAEAYWLKAALPAARQPAGAPTAFRTAGDDFGTEVSWLMQVSRAYRRTDLDTAK